MASKLNGCRLVQKLYTDLTSEERALAAPGVDERALSPEDRARRNAILVAYPIFEQRSIEDMKAKRAADLALADTVVAKAEEHLARATERQAQIDTMGFAPERRALVEERVVQAIRAFRTSLQSARAVRERIANRPPLTDDVSKASLSERYSLVNEPPVADGLGAVLIDRILPLAGPALRAGLRSTCWWFARYLRNEMPRVVPIAYLTAFPHGCYDDRDPAAADFVSRRTPCHFRFAVVTYSNLHPACVPLAPPGLGVVAQHQKTHRHRYGTQSACYAPVPVQTNFEAWIDKPAPPSGRHWGAEKIIARDENRRVTLKRGESKGASPTALLDAFINREQVKPILEREGLFDSDVHVWERRCRRETIEPKLKVTLEQLLPTARGTKRDAAGQACEADEPGLKWVERPLVLGDAVRRKHICNGPPFCAPSVKSGLVDRAPDRKAYWAPEAGRNVSATPLSWDVAFRLKAYGRRTRTSNCPRIDTQGVYRLRVRLYNPKLGVALDASEWVSKPFDYVDCSPEELATKVGRGYEHAYDPFVACNFPLAEAMDRERQFFQVTSSPVEDSLGYSAATLDAWRKERPDGRTAGEGMAEFYRSLIFQPCDNDEVNGGEVDPDVEEDEQEHEEEYADDSDVSA